MMRRCLLAVSGVLTLLAGTSVAAPQEWGTLKGQVVLDGAPPKGGATVVNPKNMGVRWVIVALVEPPDAKVKLPVHPDLAQPKEKTVTLTATGKRYEPRILCLREGQSIVARNADPEAHCVKINSPPDNPSVAHILKPDASLTIEGWKASRTPSGIDCPIHPQMRAWVRVFAHPYFAVTDEDGNFEIKNAPAGNWNLFMWQEETGWIPPRAKTGVPVTIKANGVTDLGTTKMILESK